MITPDCIQTMLPIVADSWEQLRGCDVFRLLDQIVYDNEDSLEFAADVIRGHRPDLTEEIQDAVNEFHFPEY